MTREELNAELNMDGAQRRPRNKSPHGEASCRALIAQARIRNANPVFNKPAYEIVDGKIVYKRSAK